MAIKKKPSKEKKVVEVKEEQALVTMKNQANKATTLVNDLKIADQQGYTQAEDLLKKISTVKKMVKAEKDKVLAPLLEAERAERGRWKPIETDIEMADKILREKMGKYLFDMQEKARIEQEKIEKDLENGKIKRPETAAKKLDAIQERPELENTSVSQVRKVRINDPKLVPDEYWVIDEIKVRKDALAGKEIPGVEVYLDNQIKVR